VRQLPEMNKLWREAQQRDDLAIVTVAVDMDDTMPRLRKVLRENHVRFPVLHYTAGEEPGDFGWGVDTLPTDLLIDPQGNIIRRTWVHPQFLDELKYCQSQGAALPKVCILPSEKFHPDGSVTLTFVVSNTAHTPLDVEVGGWWEYTEPRDFAEGLIYPEGQEYKQHIEFGEFGDYTFSVEVPARDGVKEFYYYALTNAVPETAGTFSDEGLIIIADHRVWDLDKPKQ
jgi:hypothetical protein